MLSTLWIAVQPLLPELIGMAATAIVGNVAIVARRRFNIDMQARHREALHSALTTGAQLAIDRKLTSQAAINLILAYARQSVPDAIKALKPGADILENLARAKLAKAAK